MEAHPYYQSWLKRAFDLLLSVVLLIVLSPLLLFLGALIVMTSGWPILYSQSRTGKNKKTFRLFKFRVMYVGAEKNQWRYQKDNLAPKPMYKNWQDPRFVGIGKWLSQTGLDELPQLLNIIKGEMSFIGPRPLPVFEANQLPKSWDFRYQVKPGIFSEWSYSKDRYQSKKRWLELEKKGLNKGSLAYEIKLIIATLEMLIRG